MLTLVQAVERLLAADKILLLCHKNPDGDTVGSASALLHALRTQGKTVGIACSDPIPSRYDHMQVTAFAGEFEPEYIVAVDVAGLQLFGPGTVEWAQKSNLCIDHHASHSHYADGLVLDGTAAACAEIMYKLLLEMGTEITPLIADCLYTGVATDTGCFKFANVTPETHKIAAALMECGAHHTKLNAKLFESKSRSQLAVERQILRNMEFYYEGRCALTWLTLDDIAATGAQPVDLESTTCIARAIEGVMVGITMRQQPSGSWKISVRAAEEMNASSIATAFGGGGHRGAAGCEVFGGLENAKQALLAEVARHLPTEDELGGEGDW